MDPTGGGGGGGDTIPLLLTSNKQQQEEDSLAGVSDYLGRPVQRGSSGGWRSALFVVGVEIAGSFAYFGISANLITYLTGPLGQSNASAAASVNAWSGTACLMPLLGAFLADAYLGRYRSVIIACTLYVLVWWTVLSVLGADASPVGDVTILVWWDRWRARWHGERQKGADTLFALVAWEIWKERNARCFRHTSSNITQLLSIIRANADLWIQGGARHLGCLIRE